MRKLILFTLFMLCKTASSWEAHYLLTHETLRTWPKVSSEAVIAVTSLENFVTKHKDKLMLLLRDHEAWAQKNVPAYPPLPSSLIFDGRSSPSSSITKKFLMSLRINPEISYGTFLLYPDGVEHRISKAFNNDELSQAPIKTLAKMRSKRLAVEKIEPDDHVSALETLVAASEEPDHGLDWGLWQDNRTAYGSIMGFGEQPFGNPILSYASQAPFHMGFFYESPILYWAAGFLKRCYPEYRIYTFLSLSRFAFEHDEIYWGYRFLGWAAHYIQDLTQPYHAKLAPGVSTFKLLWVNILEIFGFKGPAQDVRQLLTNRHLALEHYQFEATIDLTMHAQLSAALHDERDDKTYLAYNVEYPRRTIALNASNRAEHLDDVIRQALPQLYIADPTYIFDGETLKENLHVLAITQNKTAATNLDEEFLTLMRAFGAHTRNTIRGVAP